MIPPHELKNKEFTRVMRGYSIPEVDEYISFVMEKYTELYRENDALERRLQSALDSLEAMHAEEESVRTALINAQKAGKKIVADASDRADKIMRSTKSDCLRVLAEFRDKAAAERKTIMELKTSVAQLKEELFRKYQEHIEYIERLAPDAAAEAASMQSVDNEAYADKITESIEQLIKEDYNFTLRDEAPKAAREDQAGDTQVFAKVEADPVPPVHHVSLSEEPILSEDPASASDRRPAAPAEEKKTAPAEDADELLEALAAEMGKTLLVTDNGQDPSEL